MKRVLSGNSLPDTTHFKNLLEHAGIACVIKNRELGGGLGDLPVFDCAPELWVLTTRRREPRRSADPRQRAAGSARRAVALLAVRRRQRSAVRGVLALRRRATAGPRSAASMRWLDRLLVLCAAVVVLANLLPLGARWLWMLELTSHFRVQYLAVDGGAARCSWRCGGAGALAPRCSQPAP